MGGSGARVRFGTSRLGMTLLLASTFATAGADEPAVEPVAVGRDPDRIILTWNGDPATSQAVTWRTDSDDPPARAQLARAHADPRFTRRAREVPAVTQPLDAQGGKVFHHTCVFGELESDTTYAYRVGNGKRWSEWFHFQTASRTPEPFSFIYFGDAQNDIKSLWSRVVREAFRDAPRARFLLHAGDLVDNANSDKQWGEWFGAGGWVNGTVPSVPTPGNHEYARESSRLTRHLSHHWRPQFALPENGPKGLEETAYWFDIQGLRVISLNSNERVGDQAVWVDAVLADNPAPWTIVTFHHPVFSTKSSRDNPEVRRHWKPVFDRRRVDLVLQGHDHAYGRFTDGAERNLPTGAAARSEETGTVYVVSVSGPKMYDLQRTPNMRRAGENTQLYQVVSIDGAKLRYEARTAIGELYDAFELEKQPGQPNRLIEIAPEVPERLGPTGEAKPVPGPQDGAKPEEAKTRPKEGKSKPGTREPI